jgi:transcriptional regulator with XRE-family HTH domain
LYLFGMKRKKPGPPKGRRHVDVKRSPFGQRLYSTRKARGLTQEQLAGKVGLSKRMITYYEGEPLDGPPLSTLTKIAEALSVTASYLLGESTLKKVQDDLTPTLRKHVQALQKLPTRDRNAILRMAELVSKSNGSS